MPGRCRATNLCVYCARLAAVENAEVLALDALHGTAPVVWMVLTTRSTDPDPASFYKSRELLQRAIREHFEGAQFAYLVEFTTGYGTRSEGQRRPHWNVLVKGVQRDQVDALKAIVDAVWCEREDAEPEGQWVGTIEEMGGLMRYIALHFQKQEQAPPEGWRGHRFLKSRGYLWTDTPTAREAAKQSLRFKREVHKLDQADADLDPELVDFLATRALYEANELGWELCKIQALPTAFGLDGMPEAWTHVSIPIDRSGGSMDAVPADAAVAAP